MPIVRTFITVMAGVGRMDFRAYDLYSAIGGILWGTGVTLLGYYLGNVAFIANHIEIILIGVVAVSRGADLLGAAPTHVHRPRHLYAAPAATRTDLGC